MTVFAVFRARRRARVHASVDVFVPDEVVLEMLGARPVWDPIERHAAVADALIRAPDIDERESVIRHAEIEREHAFPRPLYLAAALLAFLIEAVAFAQLFREAAVESSWRGPLALMASAFAIGITHLLGRVVRGEHTAPESSKSGKEGIPRILVVAGVILAYGIFMLGVALLRAQGSAGEDGTVNLPLATLMIAATIGPAWIAERLLHLYARSMRARNMLRTVRRERASLVRARERAEELRADVVQAADRWERDASQIRAAYVAAHRFHTAHRREHSLDTNATPPRGLLPPGGIDHQHGG